MDKKILIQKIRDTTSAVDLYNMKEEILSQLEGTKKKGSDPND